jgi:undecaprenyl diphosphate synthase
MELLEQYITEAIHKMERDRVKMRFFGDTSALSDNLQRLIAETEEISSRFDGVTVNICLNYGSRDELLRAAQRYRNDKDAPEKLDEETFSGYLYSRGIPDPDLVIRPGGETRLSNFLLWQTAYSELYFCDTLWPDFDERAMNAAIIDYQSRSRRYGGVK